MPSTLKIRVKGDLEAWTKHLNAAERKHIPLATVRGLNRTLSWVRTQAKREGAAAIRVPVGVVNRRMKQHKARRRDRSALLRILTGDINVASLRARQTKTGVSAGQHRFPGAFLAKGIGGHRVALRRQGPPRLPVDAMKIQSGPLIQLLTTLVQVRSRERFKHFFEQDLRARIKGYVSR